ncbi:MAG: hypothetical protein A2033_06315 [Bacteroidetes bacterium GWA2_31_9]|nr:MAG: hypothetical protein A2033_06315 [Bacteroidetes bacterium GWA2_31_9]
MSQNTQDNDLSAMKNRADKLALQKSHLQLIVNMMQKLDVVSGLENTIDSLLKIMIGNIGGTNVLLYYIIDNEIYFNDIHNSKSKIENITDELVKKVFKTKKFIEIEQEFNDTLLHTPEFTKAYTWIFPLLVGKEIIGVIKIENIHITSLEFKNELQTFFNYVAILLKNDILSDTNFKNIQSNLENEKKFNEELIKSNSQYAALNEEYVTTIDELKKVNDFTEMLINNIPDPVFVKDKDHKWILINDALCEMMGHSREEIIGKSDYDYFSKEQADIYWEGDNRVFKTGEMLQIEELLTDSSGNIHYIQTKKRLAQAQNGSNILVCVIRDITQRKLAERDITSMNRALRMLSETNKALVHITDEKTLLSEICRITVDIGGYRLAWIGFAEHDDAKTLLPVAHAGSGSEYIKSAKVSWADNERGRGPGGVAIRTGKPSILRCIQSDENFAPWRDAAIKHGYNSIIALPLMNEGKAFGALGIYSFDEDSFDVKEVEILKELTDDLAFGITSLRIKEKHKIAEDSLFESEERYRTLIEQASDGIFLHNSDGKIIDINQRACESLGYSREELLTMNVSDIDIEVEVKQHKENIWDNITPDKPATFEGMHCRKDGSVFPVEVRLGKLELGNEKLMLALARDITERKQAEEERKNHVRFLEDMDKINKVIHQSTDMEQMMHDTLEQVLSIFDCDRAFLLYPCDLEAESWFVPMECTKPEYPGVLKLNSSIPLSEDVATTFRILLNSENPVKFGLNTPYPLPADASERFGFKSLMSMAIYPKVGKPWQFGLHQCTNARQWKPYEERLLQEIGRRLSDVLTGLLTLRNLKESEQKFRSLTENTPDNIMRYDKNCRTIYLNQNLEKTLKTTFEDIKNLTPTEFKSDGRFDNYENYLRDVIATGKEVEFELKKFDTLDKDIFHLIKMVPEYNESGEIIGALAIGRDITEHKQTELILKAKNEEIEFQNEEYKQINAELQRAKEKVEEKENKLSAITNQASEGIALSDLKGNYIFVNPSFCKMTGYSENELLKMTVFDLKVSSQPSGIFEESKTTKEGLPLEVALKRKDDTIFYTEIVGKVIKINNQNFVLGIVRDITQRKHTEDTLRFIAQRGWLNDSNTFFNTLVQYLGKMFNLDYVLIDRLEDNHQFAETVALYANGSIVPNMRYELKHTPCENVINKTLCCYPNNIQALFPEDHLLKEMNVESYAGIPLWDSTGQVIGLIAVMDSKPILNENLIIQILQLVATRVAAEIERESSDNILKESEEKYRSLAENIPDCIMRYDKNCRTIYLNQILEKALNTSFEEIKNLTPTEFQSDGRFDIYEKKLKHVIETGQETELEFSDYDTLGKVRYNVITMIPEYNKDGEIIGALALGKDITERKQSELLLKEKNEEIENQNEEYKQINVELQRAKEKAEDNENKLKEAQSIAHIGSWELDLINNKLTWSDEIYRIFGCKCQEFGATYEAFLGFIHPEDRDFVNDSYMNHINQKIPYNIVHRLLLANNEIKYVNERCRSDFDEQGNPFRSLGTVQDITEKVIAEEALLRTQYSIDNITDSIFWINKSGKLIFANQAACRNLEYSIDELLTLTVFDIDPAFPKEKWKEHWKEIFLRGSFIIETIHCSKSGKQFPVEVIVNQVEFNGVQYNCSIARDITERKQAELLLKEKNTEYLALNEELSERNNEYSKLNSDLVIAKEKAEESNRLKTEFLHNMSHEIRTPMNGIIGFSRLLNSPNISEEKSKQFVNIIINSSNQLLRIIDDILEISQLNTKQIKLVEEKVCLNDLLLRIFAIFNIKAKEKKIHLYLKNGLPDNRSIILVDETKLCKIINNLIENALKFTHDGYIEVGYLLKDKMLEIYVKDTGIGINLEKQEIIFDRFSQEEKGTSKLYGGLGLGLSIAKENAELLGGSVSLKSKKGNGSTFILTIPYKSDFIENEANPDYVNNNNEHFTILIAEDEEINYLYLEELLSCNELKLIVLHAKNGQEAVDICKKNKEVNLILMDIKMPIMSGYEATKHIKELYPNLPIIAQTAYSTTEEKNFALSAGCDDFISKPIDEERLNLILSQYLIQKP